MLVAETKTKGQKTNYKVATIGHHFKLNSETYMYVIAAAEG